MANLNGNLNGNGTSMVKKVKSKTVAKPKISITKAKKNGHYELSPDKLRWSCPESYFNFKSTEEIDPLDSIIGQPRAIEAIRLGAELNSKGYNIFVSGLSGTGRLSTVKRILEEVTTTCPITYDYCYVNNFCDQDHPRLLKLPRGMGKDFSKAMHDAVTFFRQRIPKLFEEDSFLNKRRKIIEKYQEKERQILQQFDERIRPHGFVRGQVENEQGIAQPEVFPVIENKPVQIESLTDHINAGTITKEKGQEIQKLYSKYHNEIYDLARKGMKIMQEFRQSLVQNDQAAVAMIATSVLEEIKEKFPYEKIDLYIDEVKNYVLENLNIFIPEGASIPQFEGNGLEPPVQDGDRFIVFSVNVILDNSNTNSAPVITETTPSYTNLFGTIERSFDNRGYWRTDFTKIKAGSILRADQGFVIVNANDLFSEPGVWTALKRVLLYDKLEIQPYDVYFQFSQFHLKPEPIDVNVKVIIIGGESLYHMLCTYEKGFKKIFKVNAQFDYETARTDELINNIPRFISKICRKENLPHCTPDGVAAIVEWAVEHAGGSQKRISLKFSDIADILREAAFYDRSSNRKFVNRDDVEKAMLWRRQRNNLIDEKLKYHILAGNILIDTTGERIGQLNALTVLDTGTYAFGKPARLTASVSVGNSGIVNIEREVDMSGSTHNKGVMILNSIIRERFAQEKPLNFYASITFEQSYSGVDGDSATAAEIYVILSALSQIPIKQGIAVTGSVNQRGDIQPIGGINYKITGFYEICKEKGLTGEQGIILPIQNVADLMLNEEIIQAVRDGLFHLYPISRYEEGIEILMGIPAGDKMKNGLYQKNTIFGMVEDRLEQLHKASKDEDNKKKPQRKKKPVGKK